MKVIIYEDEKGRCCVLHPMQRFLDTLTGTEEEKLIHVADKDLPTGTSYEIIEKSDLPSREFRNAWKYQGGENERLSNELSRQHQFKYRVLLTSDLTEQEKTEFGVI